MKRKRLIISTISIIILLSFITIFILIRNKSLASEMSLTSKNYHIEESLITNISPNTDIELFYKYFDTTNCSITVTNENNEPLTNGFIYTGSKTNVYDTTNTLVKSYTNIITGDINYDGLVDIKDMETLATYLIEENNLNDYQKKAIDLNKDNNIKINDLTLLESYLNSSYESISFNNDEIILMSNEEERLVPTINPNIILNQNLNWTSSNEGAITVDESGKITAHNEGESIITATTKDGNISSTKKIVVDNTIRLLENSGTVYSGGDPIEVGIKSLKYDDLTCTSSNESIVQCQIENEKLIVIPSNNYGDVTITVTSPQYGEAIYNVTCEFTSLNVYLKGFSREVCVPPNASFGPGLISGFGFGTITATSSDKSIVSDARIIKNSAGNLSINVTTGSQTGDATVTFEEDHGHKKSVGTVHVYRLYLSNSSGTTTTGNNLISNINNQNAGNLSCISSNSNIATCQIEENQLIVTPQTAGTATITITGDKCGQVNYTANITESTPPPPETTTEESGGVG